MKRIGRPPIPLADRFWQHVAKAGPDDCWPWTGGCYSNGYGRITRNTYPDKSRDMALAHRVAWELTNGPIPKGKSLCHTCDTRYPVGDTTYRRCCNPAHARPGTAFMNMHDAIASKRLHTRGDKRGAGNGRAILNDDKVREIRARHANGETQVALAREFGIGLSALHAMIHRKTWAHV